LPYIRLLELNTEEIRWGSTSCFWNERTSTRFREWTKRRTNASVIEKVGRPTNREPLRQSKVKNCYSFGILRGKWILGWRRMSLK